MDNPASYVSLPEGTKNSVMTLVVTTENLEDHPRTCKWLITMVIVSPLSKVVPIPNGLTWMSQEVSK